MSTDPDCYLAQERAAVGDANSISSSKTEDVCNINPVDNYEKNCGDKQGVLAQFTTEKTDTVVKSEHQTQLPHAQKYFQEGRCCSELDLRATSMRAKIEQKLVEIEAGMQLHRHSSAESETYDLDAGKLDSDVGNMQIMDVKRSHSYSMSEMKESAIARLEQELDKAQQELKLKDEEVFKLTKVRDEVGAEIEDLTASLFEEANNMVRDANEKQAKAERRAKEANMKLSILQEEVKALKSLIQATMSYRPCCVPKNDIASDKFATSSRFVQHQASVTFICNDVQNKDAVAKPLSKSDFTSAASFCKREQYEPDPILHREFVSWRQNPVIDKKNLFLQRIYVEDINPCMNFENKELCKKVMQAIEKGTVAIENLTGKGPLPKMCALLQTPRFCRYRMNLGDEKDYYISSLSRNRIAAICDLFFYLRYIEKGLIKDTVHEVYLEVLRKRKAITIARLGLPEADET